MKSKGEVIMAKKLSKKEKMAYELLLKRVRFETASFARRGGHMSDKAFTDEIREVTKLYTETWIVSIIEALRDGTIHTWKEDWLR